MEKVKFVNSTSKVINTRMSTAGAINASFRKHSAEPSIYNSYKKQYQDQIEAVSQNVWDFFMGVAIKYGYEERLGQQDMALDIVECLREEEHIAVEAGVGIGKSFGYLVPLSYLHRKMGLPIAISTSTIALQEQLANDIKEVARMTGHDIEVVLAKGQTHFLCKRRASEYSGTERICDLQKSNYKEKKDIPFNIDIKVWNKINVHYNFKDCNVCTYKQGCHYFHLRERMYASKGIILCNHDLLIAHLKKKAGRSKIIAKWRHCSKGH